MKYAWNKCKKFSYLLNEIEDRPLGLSESSFMEHHQRECAECERLTKGTSGLNMLRSSTIDPVIGQNFDERLIRRIAVQAKKSNFSYWSPAFLSGAIAGLAVLAAIQMISRPEQMPVFKGTGEARKVGQPIFPELKDIENTRRPQ